MSNTFEPWNAQLTLAFTAQGCGRTVLARNRHEGPLLVQKALYPEGPAICHATILHPPSGIAGGDHLSMDIELAQGSHAVLSTPGATRWYKSNGHPATQRVALRLDTNARLDWLPQENIFFEHADAASRTCLDIHSGACAIGWDITQLGRIGQAGHWNEGRVLLDSRATLDGDIIWLESGELDAKCPLRRSQNGLADFPVMATLWAFGPALSNEHIDALASSLPWTQTLRAGMTQLPQKAGQGLSLLRVLGLHVQHVKQLLIALWMQLRPLVMRTPGAALRLWNT